MLREPQILAEYDSRSELLTVVDEEADHLVKVLRARSGFIFRAFDGLGNGWQAELIDSRKKCVTARIVETLPADPILLPELAVAVGVVKGSRMDWAVEKAAELGAAKFIPLMTEFSEIEPGIGRLERWRGLALAAAKQSHRLKLMTIDEPVSLKSFLSQGKSVDSILALDLCEEAELALKISERICNPDNLTLLIGPEGGFSEGERADFIKLGICSILISDHVLRTETAVAIGLGLIRNIYAGI
jgi:16S rRNA (uracil1498-N3)-methyltransferase